MLYLGEKLRRRGIPISPVGSPGVSVDARRFLPHVPQEHFPAEALAAALYLDSGFRAMEGGIVSVGCDPRTGEESKPRLKLVRLTIPRRVYTQAHMDVTAESVYCVQEERARIRGLRMTLEPKFLSFFQARFEPPAGKLM